MVSMLYLAMLYPALMLYEKWKNAEQKLARQHKRFPSVHAAN